MSIKQVEEALLDYKRKKSVVETTLERIKVFERAINNPEEHEGLFLGPSKEPGMPKGSGYSGTSAVEHEVLSNEEQTEVLKQWIKDDKSRIYPYEVEIKQIEGALKSLTHEERYIVECKYFEKMFWRNIEISFNDRFRQQNYITTEGIKKINRQALEILTEILNPYFCRFEIEK